MLTLRDTPEQAELRAQTRTWIQTHLPDRLRWSTDGDSALELDRLLALHGFLAPGWPVAYGGRGLVASQEFVVNQELEAAGVQRATSPSHQGVNNFAPALMRHGTEVQKARLLPSILAVKELWCQGFSEPDAGSDLASVRTSARLEGDLYLVNGSKVWTSGAEQADFIYLLVRTGTTAQRHKGLSFLYAPMSTPGISTQPITQITGGSDFSQVTLDDVRIPEANLIGAPGEGWTVAMTLLSAERLSGRHRYGLIRRELADLARELGASGPSGEVRNDALRDLGRLVAEVEGMGALALRIESLRAAGKDPGALPSVNKLWWPAVHQRLAETGLRRADGSQPAIWYQRWLAARPESIYGGSAQIQRNIIAERFLGLPR